MQCYRCKQLTAGRPSEPGILPVCDACRTAILAGGCPCDRLPTHPFTEHGYQPHRVGYDDPIAEHAAGEHDRYPDPECCVACVVEHYTGPWSPLALNRR